MSDARDSEAAGAPVEETAANEADIRAAVERAQRAGRTEHAGAANGGAYPTEEGERGADAGGAGGPGNPAADAGAGYPGGERHGGDAYPGAGELRTGGDDLYRDGRGAPSATGVPGAAGGGFAHDGYSQGGYSQGGYSPDGYAQGSVPTAAGDTDRYAAADGRERDGAAEGRRPLVQDYDELPSAGSYRSTAAAADTEPYDPLSEDLVAQDAAAKAQRPAQPETIQVEKDHPMAALYLQAPVPPELAGNRGAGILISLLAALGFAVVYAGVIALGLARHYPPSTFLSEGLLPHVMSIGFIAAVAGFFVGMVILVLIVGRAGWWAYVLGGFWVGVFVWAAATVGYGFSPEITGLSFQWDLSSLAAGGSIPQVLAAAVVAREVSVWFGAWIGRRGRRVTARNREAIADYEAAVAESKAPAQVS